VKRLIVSALLVASMLGVSAGSAAAGGAIGGCLDGYNLQHSAKKYPGVDHNGDGYVCVASIPAFPPGSVNVIDNNT